MGLKKTKFIIIFFYQFTIPLIINNFLKKFLSKKNFNEIKTICVGNIYLGGTGKTPFAIKLYEILKKKN